jgi:formylglycine-generating enzyme required for sulfatase activity
MYEADAIARFLGGRLPTEAEWELAASSVEVDGHFLDSQAFAPHPPTQKERIGQMFGDVWEWTRSSYEPYPGYEPPSGALGEYNGKFMIAQVVLRGGSCLTPRGHVRASYRNFWYPETRFQMTGLRIARDI